jgi:hypothetical protein
MNFLHFVYFIFFVQALWPNADEPLQMSKFYRLYFVINVSAVEKVLFVLDTKKQKIYFLSPHLNRDEQQKMDEIEVRRNFSAA